MDSFISWVGGKKLLRNKICDRFPKCNYDRYIEVFGGAAWVLFNKDKHAELEVYNDINGNLVNLFKCVKYHPNAVKEELSLFLNSRELFNNFKNLHNNNALTDIQRAAMYYYMIKASYGSRVNDFGAKPRCMSDIKSITEIKERLKSVNIENKSYDAIIKQYDRHTALFYCDPPYFGSEKMYKTGDITFDESHHINLCGLLRSIKGYCIISYNDNDYIRDLYRGFNMCEVERQSNLTCRYGNKRYRELIITNY